MRLFAAVALSWVAALAAAPMVGPRTGGGPAALIALVGAMAAVALAYELRDRMRRATVASTLIAAAAAAGLVAGGHGGEPREVPEGVSRVDADVADVRFHAGRASSTLRVLVGERLADHAPVQRYATLRGDAALPLGARVEALVRTRPVAPYRNPTPHPPWPLDLPDGRFELVSSARVRVLRHDVVAELLESARQTTRDALERSLDPRAAGMARALVLGDGDAVDDADRSAVRDAGLAHVLAVSGLHVSLVVGLLVALLRRVLAWLPTVPARWDARRLAALAGVPLAIGYAAFAGGAPSAWRAGVTAAIGLGLVAAGRRPRAISIASAAAALLGALSPDQVGRPGFVLSILATTAVVTTRVPDARHVERPSPASRALSLGLAVSARTTAATAPVVLWCFGTVPVIGVVANLILVPVGALLLVPLASLHAALAVCAPPLARLSGGAFETTSAAFVAACDAMAGLAPSPAPPPLTLLQGITVGVACVGLLALRTWRSRLVAVAICAAALAGGEIAVRKTERPMGVLRATFLDVGQGDAALLDMPDGRLVVVDTGGSRSRLDDPGRRVLVPILEARRRSHVDVVVLSHPHPDHYGGLEALLGAMPVAELWDSGQAEAETPGGEASRLLSVARAGGTRVLGPPALCGRDRRFGAARLRVLAPCPRYDSGRDPNDNSIVLRVDLGARSLVLAGDAEAHQEGRLAAEHAPLGADVLKVAHHGSRTSSTDAFLAAVRPALAIISAGRDNRFGHPHPEALRRLKHAGARIVRLDHAGGTVVTTDGYHMEVRSFRGDRYALP